ncbi:MAG: cysteine--tRNA ligase [Mycoplasmoidaceae bacterium]
MNKVINLIDSSSKKLKELNKDSISIYLCGPTVYNHVHIGNIRPIITYDVLHRYLIHKKVKVNFVHNITDIDDKIIVKAAEMNISEKELSQMFFEQYKLILKRLNIYPVKMPNVSENMDSMIEMIEELIKKNHAYEIDGNVYFSTKNFKDYGIISSMEIDKLNHGERVGEDLNKENKHDFVLWKNTKDGIRWESSMGLGRPGWHTECCVLINKYIGKQVDIHGGGIDLRFPHHENENVQNLARYGLPLAKIWMHTGHLMIEEEKMSKSLNNFILAKDLINKSDPNSVRWMFYQTRYEKPINYTDKILEESKKKIDQIERDLNKAYSYLILNDSYNKIETISEEILNIFNDNLNLPNIVTIVYDRIKLFSSNILSKNFNELNKIYNDVKNTLDLLGIVYQNIHTNENIELIKTWNQLLIDKKFKEADEIRERLIIMKLI